MNEIKNKSSKQQSPLYCRACLSTDCRLYDIHEYKVDEAFFRITDTPMSQDLLPQHLCAWCLTLLHKCASFRAMCVRTQLRLTEILESRMGTDSVPRCQPPLRSFHLTKTAVNITYCVPENIIYYQPEDVLMGDIVKAEPEIEHEIIVNNEVEDSFDFKDEIDINCTIQRETTVKENSVFKIGNSNDEINASNADDNGNPLNNILLKIELNHNEDEMGNNDNEIKDSLVLEDNKNVNCKNKNLSGLDNYVKPGKQKKANVKIKQIKRNKRKVNFKDNDKSNGNIKYEYVLEENVSVKKVKPVKRGRPRTKRKIKDLRHATEGYILFDFASFEKAYAVKVVVLSKEEQLEEIASRKKSRNYVEAPLKCEECGRGFYMQEAYTNHRARQHNPKMDHRCNICGMRFRGNCYRQRHEDVHRLKFPCNKCDFVSRSREQAKAHHDMHAGKMFVCQHCGKSFNKRSSCLSHVRLTHPENNVVCVECGETFVSDRGLQDHVKKTHPESLVTKQFKCSTCSANFTSLEALNRHTDTAGDHADLRPCEQCGENCASEAELHQHVGEKHGTESHHCDVCKTTFSSTAAYNTHYRRRHLGERYRGPARPRLPQLNQRRPVNKPCVCDQCGYIARNSSLLIYHMRSHLAVKPFACAHCPKTFEIKMKLIYHLRTHTGDKPYQCSECPLAFAIPGNLKRHHKTIHLKQHDIFSCEICARTFTTKGMLKMHVKTIHEGMPWPKRVRKPRGMP